MTACIEHASALEQLLVGFTIGFVISLLTWLAGRYLS